YTVGAGIDEERGWGRTDESFRLKEELAAVGVESTAWAVAEHYGSGLLDGWLVDTVDAAGVERIEEAGIRCRAVPLMMSDADATARMAREALALAEEVRAV
ncbi:hypothetical protein ACFVH9_34715, partial [Streptomyces hirsutus]